MPSTKTSETELSERLSSQQFWVDSAASVIREGIRTRLTGDAAASRGFAVWAQGLWLEGQRLSFDRFPWMEGIYRDTAPHIIARKCTQVGFTVWAVLRCIYYLMTLYRAVLYYFPTKVDVTAFVQGRVDPIIAENEDIQKYIRSTNNTAVKRVGPGHLYFRGMKSKTARKSTNADCIVLDELDEMVEQDPKAPDEAEGRMAASQIKHTIKLGNPSFPDYGISREYDESDQRAWHLRCPSCSQWACPDLTLPEKAGVEVPCIQFKKDGTAFLACEHCGGELNTRGDGRWIPIMPGQGRPHGYACSQVNRPDANLGRMLKKFQETDHLGVFKNLEWGKPHIDAENRVTKEEVLARCSDIAMMERTAVHCTMGIDSGKNFHWVVSHPQPNGLRFYPAVGIAHSYDELNQIIKRYSVWRFVCDGMPEVLSTEQWIKEQHRGRGFRCFFNENYRQAPKWDEVERKVIIDRTFALDASRAIVRKEVVVYPRRDARMEAFATHYQNDAKKLDEDPETGSRVYRYFKLKAENHWSFAATYDAMIWRFGGGPAAGSSSGKPGIPGARRDPTGIPGARPRKPRR